MVRVLVVEDDQVVRESLAAHLTRGGHDVVAVGDGPGALTAYASGQPDIVLLDLMLPGMGGLEVCRRLRTLRPDLPLIMVTARGQEHERVQGLQHGADDYVTKPFSLRELDLRIRSVLRRSAPPPEAVVTELVDGDLTVDRVARTATRGGMPLRLTARELDLLDWLIAHPGQVCSRADLIREVWGWQAGDDSTVTVHVRRLREKVEADPSSPRRLVTVFGKGYRWVPAQESAHGP